MILSYLKKVSKQPIYISPKFRRESRRIGDGHMGAG